MTDSELTTDATRRFMWAVQALAASAGEQRQLFPEFTEPADELGLDYEEAPRTFSEASERISSVAQRASVRALTEQLEQMSGLLNAQFWSVEALDSAPEWRLVRELAANVLRVMGWPRELPPRDRSIYVGPPGA